MSSFIDLRAQLINSKKIVIEEPCNSNVTVRVMNIPKRLIVKTSKSNKVRLETTVYYGEDSTISDKELAEKSGITLSKTGDNTVLLGTSSEGGVDIMKNYLNLYFQSPASSDTLKPIDVDSSNNIMQLEVNNLDSVRSEIKIESDNMESTDSATQAENNNLEGVDSEMPTETNDSESIDSTMQTESNNLGDIDNAIEIETETNGLESIDSAIQIEANNLESIDSAIQLESVNLENGNNSIQRGDDDLGKAILYIPSDTKLEIQSNEDVNIENNLKEVKVYINNTSFRMKDADKASIVTVYGHINTGNIKSAEIDISNGTLVSQNIDVLNIISKSSDIQFNNAKEVIIKSSMNDQYEMDEVGKLQGSKEYGNLRIGTIKNSLQLNGTNAEIRIRNIKNSANSIKIDNTYADIRLPVSKLQNYTIDYEGQFSNIFAPFDVQKNQNFKISIGNIKNNPTVFQLKCDNCSIDFR